MNVIDLIQNHKGTAFFFLKYCPPLKGAGIERLFHTIDTLREFNPAYINITNHRSEYVYKDLGGGIMQRLRIRRRPGTIAVAAAIQRHYDIHVVPHIPCSGYTREDTEYMLLDLQFLGISDLLVLRGDKAKEDPAFRPTATVIHMPRNLSGTSTVSMTVSSSTVRPSVSPAHRFHTVWLAIRKT